MLLPALAVACGDDGGDADGGDTESGTGTDTSAGTFPSLTTDGTTGGGPAEGTGTGTGSDTGAEETAGTTGGTNGTGTGIATTTETSTADTGTAGSTGTVPCETDTDEDGICDDEDLCNDAAGSHCLVFGVDAPVVMSTDLDAENDTLAPLFEAPIRMGLTLEVTGTGDAADCEDAEPPARAFDAAVTEIRFSSEDEEAMTYLQGMVLAGDLADENLNTNLQVLADGGLSVQVYGMVPGHYVVAQSQTSDTACADFDGSAPVTGTGGSLTIRYYDDATGPVDRVQGDDASWSLVPFE